MNRLIIYIIILILCILLFYNNYKLNKKLTCIPRHIIQTWKSHDNLPEYAVESMNTWKKLNPDYTYKLYDNDECYEYIHKHFGERVSNAFTNLIPGAFKADLFRYCILYVEGGIYADIDSIPLMSLDKLFNYIGNYKFISCLERLNIPGVYQAFIACHPGCEWFKIAIDMIVDNVENRRMFNGNFAFLEITGPILLSNAMNKHINNQQLRQVPLITSEWYLLRLDDTCTYIMLDGQSVIMTESDIARKEKHTDPDYYRTMMRNGEDFYKNYQDNKKYDTIYQCYHDKSKIPQKVYNNISKFAPNYKHQIYDNDDCRKFLTRYYGEEYVSIFNHLLLNTPAHAADFWRYCILYKYGGVYLDIKIELIEDMDKTIKRIGDATFSTILSIQKNTCMQGVIMSKPNHPILKMCIDYMLSSYTNAKDDYFLYTKNMYTSIVKYTKQNKLHQGINSDVFLFQENCSNTNVCYDGLDRHGYCCFVTYNGEKVIKTRYADYPW